MMQPPWDPPESLPVARTSAFGRALKGYAKAQAVGDMKAQRREIRDAQRAAGKRQKQARRKGR